MIALMSIKACFVSRIADGSKRVELRKSAMRKPVSQIAIYESRGRGKVVGFFDVGRIVEEPPAGIWRRYAKVAGVTKAEFFEYFAQSVSGVAIEIKKFHELRSPIPLQDLNPAYRPPQSFFYITEEEFGLIQRSA